MAALLLACLVTTAGLRETFGNAVSNSGFEAGETAPAGWIFWARTTGRGSWDDAVAHTGQRSVRIDGVADGNQVWAQHNIPLRPGWLHRLSAWVRQDRCYSWGADIVVIARNAEGQSLQGWTFRGRPGTREWYFLEGYFLAPANATQASVELRVLLLPATAWFDDVSLVPVGPWGGPVAAADPVAEHEAKLAYLQKLSTEIETPHWDWAGKVYQAPSVLFLLDRIGQREIVELAQRFGFPWRAVAVSIEACPQYQTGEYYDNLSHADANEACLRALRDPVDVVVASGSVWTALSEEVRNRVLELVRSGGTLVYLGCPRDQNAEDEVWRALGVTGTWEWQSAVPVAAGEGALACWPEALPPIQVHRVSLAGGQVVAEARAADGTALPLIVQNTYGAGRTVYVAYMSEAQTVEVRGPGLTPFLTFGEVEDLMFPYQEYLLASVMKWLTTAGRPERWKIAQISVAVDDGRAVGLVRHDAAGPQLTARWAWRDETGKVLVEGRTPVGQGATETRISGPSLKELPGGRAFVEVIFDSPGGALDWAAACTRPQGPHLAIELDKAVYPRGAAVAGSVRVEGLREAVGARRPFRLRVCLLDCYGWEWERQELGVSESRRASDGSGNEAYVPLRLRAAGRMIAAGGFIHVQLIDAAGRVLAAGRRKLAFSADRSWDDWHQHLWSVFGRSGYREYMHPYLAEALREIGIDTLLFNIAGEEWRIGVSYDFRLIPIGIYGVYATAYGHGEYAQTRDRKYLQRRPCPNTPSEKANLERAVTNVADLLAPYSPATYCMSDENNLTYYNSSFDFCFCEHCLAELREWLKQRWGNLASLNEAWGTNFSAWEEVVPDTYEDAVQRGRFVSWADHRAFMDRVFAQVWARARDVARRIDPDARISLSGTPEPAAYGGYDWYQLLGNLDALLPYLGTEVGEMQRSWAAMPRAPWSAGYGSRGPALSFSIWRAAFNRCRGVGAFWLPSMIEPDFTLPQCSRDLERISRPLRQGLGKLLIAARPAPPQVAVYHSMPSVRAAYVHGLEVEQTDELKGLITALQSLGVAFVVVDGRQVEQGWLLQNKPAALFLPVAFAMSDEELRQVAAYVQAGGRIIFDLPPALYDDRLRNREALEPDLAELFGWDEARAIRPADELLALPAEKPWHEHVPGKSLCAGRVVLARYYRDLSFRTCPVVEENCRRCEEWLAEALAWAEARPAVEARWSDGLPVRDCVWACWELEGGRLVGVLRQASATDTRTMEVALGAGVVYDVIMGKRLSGPKATVVLGPGDVAMWAVLARPPAPPQVNVVRGALKPGQDCELEITMPDAPDPMAVRLELQAPLRAAPFASGVGKKLWEVRGRAARDDSRVALPGLGRNLLLKAGRARTALALPDNLPAGTVLVLRDVLSGAEKRLGISSGRGER